MNPSNEPQTTNSSLGGVLRERREAKGVSLTDAAAATRIKIQHIEDMERDDFSRIAAAMYAKGFIRIYADFLGLDAGPLIQEYTERHAPPDLRPALKEEPEPGRSAARPRGPSPWGQALARLTAPGPARYVAIAAAALLLLVLLAAGLARQANRHDSTDTADPVTPETHPPMLVRDPPDAFLDNTLESGTRP